MTAQPFVVVAGVGPGTGASVARRFAKAYPVVLLARGTDKFEKLAQEINDQGGKAIGISADVSSAESLASAFQQIEKEFPGANAAAAVFNAAAGFVRKPFLEVTEKEFASAWEVSQKGAFLFSQHVLPFLLKHAKDSSASHPPTLIFTGATAGVKANARVAAFATSNFAKRALAISLAKEFGPEGVHVAWANIDGPIDIPGRDDYRKDLPAEQKIDPDEIAGAYWGLHVQSKRAFTNEIDIRTSVEKW
ncbi:NAD(P)-binding protein [Karstenula rhodostoma CBS 690.94]|uniref:NAD(P)-binding protein n=1 Tax=Karstenula rhodostoma CBS 690.94 TaxID=1392251 RepID=A0A9P4PCU3_9PLEO|nr:NAD(P)-binding protein [Karstenula rhodostoma CBS 690.94]